MLIYTFKYTGKSSSICMTSRDDNDEGVFVKQLYVLHSTKFQNVWYVFIGVCICGSCSQEFSVELYIIHEGTYIRVSTISVPTVLQCTSCILGFYVFENFDLLS